MIGVRTRLLLAVILSVAVLATSACGKGEDALAEATPAKSIRQLDASFLPGELLGLPVSVEDQAATLATAERSLSLIHI